jgi:hypothetical protein
LGKSLSLLKATQPNPFEKRQKEDVLYVYEPLNEFNKKIMQAWYNKHAKKEEAEYEGNDFQQRNWTHVGGKDKRRDVGKSI